MKCPPGGLINHFLVCCVHLQSVVHSSSEVAGNGLVWGRVGLVTYRVPLMGGCWSSLSVGKLPAGWPMKMRQVMEWPGVFALVLRV